jgi:hypothetical protein
LIRWANLKTLKLFLWSFLTLNIKSSSTSCQLFISSDA